jgi:hypothetical protein
MARKKHFETISDTLNEDKYIHTKKNPVNLNDENETALSSPPTTTEAAAKKKTVTKLSNIFTN